MKTSVQICGILAGAALLSTTACRLDRRTELLEDQYLAARLDNTIASQAHLEEEYRRELSHVNALTAEVADLMAEEEALAVEADDAFLRVEESRARLAEIEADRLAAEEAAANSLAAEKARVGELLGEAESTRTPTDRTGLEARIAALQAELARLGQALEALPPPAEETPEIELLAPTPPEEVAPTDPPAGGGG